MGSPHPDAQLIGDGGRRFDPPVASCGASQHSAVPLRFLNLTHAVSPLASSVIRYGAFARRSAGALLRGRKRRSTRCTRAWNTSPTKRAFVTRYLGPSRRGSWTRRKTHSSP